MKKTPHKWQAEIVAWANGEQIQFRTDESEQWVDATPPKWTDGFYYRIKPSAPETRMTDIEIDCVWQRTYNSSYAALRGICNHAIARALADGDVILPQSRAERDMAIAKTVYDVCKNAMENDFLLGTVFEPNFQGIIASIKP